MTPRPVEARPNRRAVNGSREWSGVIGEGAQARRSVTWGAM